MHFSSSWLQTFNHLKVINQDYQQIIAISSDKPSLSADKPGLSVIILVYQEIVILACHRRKADTSDAKLDFSYAYAQMRRSEQAFTIVCYKFGCCAANFKRSRFDCRRSFLSRSSWKPQRKGKEAKYKRSNVRDR